MLWLGAFTYSLIFVGLTSVKMLAEELNKQGVALAESGRNTESIAKLRSALRYKADLVEARTNLGFLYLVARDPVNALVHYEFAAKVAPQSPVAQNGAGQALAMLGRPADAARYFREALRARPDAGPAHFNLATMLLQLGQFAEAATHYEAALQFGYTTPGVRESLERARQAAAQQSAERR